MKVVAVLLLLVMMASLPGGCGGAEEVVFRDPDLEQAVRLEIGKLDGPIYADDLVRCVSLDASGRGIADLTGIEHCTSLTLLNLHLNDVSDISPIRGLTGLVTLMLSYNDVSDISPLENLSNLEGLNLNNNRIGDVSPLRNLAGLQWLSAGRNRIVDLSPLQGLTGLGWLVLSGNRIADLAPLSGLTGLATLLLAGNQIADIGPLVANTGLGGGDKLDLSANPLGPASVDTYVPELRDRGVEVVDDAYYIHFDDEPAGSPEFAIEAVEIQGLTVAIAGSVTPGSGDASIVDVRWDWGDGISESREFPVSHVYETGGQYTIALVAHQSDGLHCKASITVIL